jgi:hypothetical protein
MNRNQRDQNRKFTLPEPHGASAEIWHRSMIWAFKEPLRRADGHKRAVSLYFMPKSIQTALWVFFGVLAFLGVLKFVLYYGGLLLMKLLVKAGQLMNTAQTRRVSLLPRDSLEWSRPEEVAQTLQELEQAGFVDAGRYEIKEMKGTKLQGLIHEEKCISAVIYDHKSRSMLDLLVHYEDGRQICYSNHTLGFSMPRPDNHLQKNYPDITATELLTRMLSECPKEGLKRIPAERFAFWFEERYAEHARWMAERGGPTFEETVQMVKTQPGGNKADEETMREMYEATTEGYLKNWLRDQPDVTDPVWEEIEFSLTVIHDGLRLETVLERFNAVMPEEMELKRSDIPEGVTDARQAFAILNGRAEMPFRRLKEKGIGLPADFYLEPSWEEEEEDNSERVAA